MKGSTRCAARTNADHDEDADHEQHRLQDVRAGVVEAEQDRERPAAGERRAEHLGADQDRGADDGDDAGPDDLAGVRFEAGWRSWSVVLFAGRNLCEMAARNQAQKAQKSPIAWYSDVHR